jgi:hypothetical protein
LRDLPLVLDLLQSPVVPREELGHEPIVRLRVALSQHALSVAESYICYMQTATEPADRVVVSSVVSREQRHELERLAREQDRTISYLVRLAVGRYLVAETREAE